MSEAQWTLHQATEAEVAESERRKARWRRTAWGIVLASFGMCPLTCLGAAGNALALPVGMIAFTVSIGYVLWRSGREADRHYAERARLQEEHALLEGWIVEMGVYQGAALTGRDQGVVWFEKGQLLFVGRRTSFTLAARDVQGKPTEGWFPSSGFLPLQRVTVAGRVGILLDVLPWSGYPFPSQRGTYAFRDALRRWMLDAVDVEGGMPPLALGPGAPRPGTLLTSAAATSAFWAVVLLGVVKASLAFGVTIALPMAMVGAVLLCGFQDVWTLRQRWRAWSDRQRLDHALRQDRDE